MQNVIEKKDILMYVNGIIKQKNGNAYAAASKFCSFLNSENPTDFNKSFDLNCKILNYKNTNVPGEEKHNLIMECIENTLALVGGFENKEQTYAQRRTIRKEKKEKILQDFRNWLTSHSIETPSELIKSIEEYSLADFKPFTAAQKKEWNEKKKEEKEKYNKRIIEIANNYQTSPDDLTEYALFSSKFYEYSSKNTMMIYSQNEYSAFIGSKSHFEEMGYDILAYPPQKPIYVYAPAIKSTGNFYTENGEKKPLTEATAQQKEDIKNNKLKIEKKIIGFNLVPVYDISQTNCPPEEYPKLIGYSERSLDHGKLADIISGYAETILQIPVSIQALGKANLRGYCSYNSVGKVEIVLSDLLLDTSRLSTLTHELGHAIMHTPKYENNQMGYKGSIKSKKPLCQKEMEADILSIMLEDKLGMEITNARKSHLKSHYEKYLEYVSSEVSKDAKTKLPLVTDIIGNVSKIFGEHWPQIESYIENDMSQHPKLLPGFSILNLREEYSNLKFNSIVINEQTHEITGNMYETVYHECVSMDNQNINLDQVYMNLQMDKPSNYVGHTLSVSDVIVTLKENNLKAYYVDSIGFQELPDEFVTEKIKECYMNSTTIYDEYLSTNDKERKQYLAQNYNLDKVNQDKITSNTYQVIKDAADEIENAKDRKLYKYYSIQRPINIGTYPNENLRSYSNYNEKTKVENCNCQAWGELVYNKPLTDEQVTNYDLVKEPDETIEITSIQISSLKKFARENLNLLENKGKWKGNYEEESVSMYKQFIESMNNLDNLKELRYAIKLNTWAYTQVPGLNYPSDKDQLYDAIITDTADLINKNTNVIKDFLEDIDRSIDIDNVTQEELCTFVDELSIFGPNINTIEIKEPVEPGTRIYKIDANPATTGIENRAIVQEYITTSDGKIKPTKIVLLGSWESCKNYIKESENNQTVPTEYDKVQIMGNSAYPQKEKYINWFGDMNLWEKRYSIDSKEFDTAYQEFTRTYKDIAKDVCHFIEDKTEDEVYQILISKDSKIIGETIEKTEITPQTEACLKKLYSHTHYIPSVAPYNNINSREPEHPDPNQNKETSAELRVQIEFTESAELKCGTYNIKDVADKIESLNFNHEGTGYDKTYFNIFNNGIKIYDGRYDIGDERVGLIQHIADIQRENLQNIKMYNGTNYYPQLNDKELKEREEEVESLVYVLYNEYDLENINQIDNNIKKLQKEMIESKESSPDFYYYVRENYSDALSEKNYILNLMKKRDIYFEVYGKAKLYIRENEITPSDIKKYESELSKSAKQTKPKDTKDIEEI